MDASGWIFDLSSRKDVIFLVLSSLLFAVWILKGVLHLKCLRKEYSAENDVDLFYYLHKKKDFIQIFLVYFPIPVLGKSGSLQSVIKKLVIVFFVLLVVLIFYYPFLRKIPLGM